MADTILTESEASLAVEDLGWRYLLDCLTTAVAVGSLSGACDVIRAAVGIAGPHADDHLRLRATAGRGGAHAGDTWQVPGDYAGR